MTPAAGNVRQGGRVWKCGHTDIVRTRSGKLRCDECERERSRRRFRTHRAERLATTRDAIAAAAAPVVVPVEAPAGERVDDGRRYPIDEWKRLFGDPPMLATSYDAWAE